MLFSSLIFLYLFLPLTLLGYYLSPRPVKNYWLLVASLIFFAWGGVSLTAVLIASIVVNYVFGLLVQNNLENKMGYRWLFVGVSVNLLLLGVYKYTDFIIQNLNDLFGLEQADAIPETGIILPIGISFYTFHSISYLVDIYRRKCMAQKNIFYLALYICMFSQLIAGPIIRYSDVWQQLSDRVHSLEKFSSGVERFLIGLGKKVLLANTFATVADSVFSKSVSDLDALNAWLGIVCYSLQIYCDFAGYSDMAIGLGRMFGFEFMENFNFPYMAKSVKEFWRRWHISLSSFFRDYVYIPLGGNRAGEGRAYLNLILVFFLTGFWHGASWSFVVWGLFHGAFMLIERLGFEKLLQRVWAPVANLYTLLVVMIAWVLFRADTLSYALDYWKAMFGFKSSREQLSYFMAYFNREFVCCFVIAVCGALGFFKLFVPALTSMQSSTRGAAKIGSYAYHLLSLVFFMSVIFLCTIYLVAGSYNPFIYFRF